MVTIESKGKLVQYFIYGWYTGYLVDVKLKKKQAIIRPIGPIGKKMHKINVNLEDVKLYE